VEQTPTASFRTTDPFAPALKDTKETRTLLAILVIYYNFDYFLILMTDLFFQSDVEAIQNATLEKPVLMETVSTPAWSMTRVELTQSAMPLATERSAAAGVVTEEIHTSDAELSVAEAITTAPPTELALILSVWTLVCELATIDLLAHH